MNLKNRFTMVCRIAALLAACPVWNPWTAAGQNPGNWAWMGGSNIAITCFGTPACPAGAGHYGTKYQPAAWTLPGYRTSAATWTGADGRLWMYGGYGIDREGLSTRLDDLWVFDPALGTHGEWTWMGGHSIGDPIHVGVYGTQYQPGSANSPGARMTAGVWTDAQGRLWLFGGLGPDANGTVGLLNDLWVFDPGLGAHGEWTWMGGSKTILPCSYCGVTGVYGTEYQFDPANMPGSRIQPITWNDSSGRLWLFSGVGYDSVGNWLELLDLWVFDPAQGAHGEWAWMGGPNIGVHPDSVGTYGTQFQFGADNIPSFHQAPAHWSDADGNFWLFGGVGSDSARVSGPLNEVWEFSPSTGAHGEWAWMGGDSTITYFGPAGHYPGQKGSFGQKYSFGDSNLPGARAFASTWTDSKNRLWLLGGDGVARYGAHGNLNDLWVFDPSMGTHGQWAWMGGSPSVQCDSGCRGRTGVYGTKFRFDRANAPGGRTTGQTWTDAQGNLWLFCSWGSDSAGNVGALRDLWEYRFLSAQTIDFTPPSTATLGTGPVTLSATATSGLAVTFKLVSGPGKLSGTHNATLSFTGTGKVVVAAVQAGDAKYSAAKAVRGSISVVKGGA